ncbi:MAG: hypothetical protein ABI583_10415 [Betaproteobacteria bacterium]
MAINKYFGNLSTLVTRGATAALFSLMTAMLVSCGGGGADGGNPLTNGTLSILPNTGSLYANVPITINVAGGRGPYFVTSNEQTVLPLNFQLNGNSFTTVPNNPGVTDLPVPGNQTPAGDTPFRTVIVTARDAAGIETTATFLVFQNFLTGYSLTVSTPTTCAVGTTTPTQACAGADSLISMLPISSGLRLPNKQFRLTATLGAFAFILDSTGITGPEVIVNTDERGETTARIRVTAGAPTQYAQFRMTDVATGAYRMFTFIITNSNGGNTALSALPSSITLGGANSSVCGTGTSNVFVFGGQPPYTANTTDPNSISITPLTVTKSGDAFSVQVFNPNICLGPGHVVITDATGAHVTIDITTTAGSAPPVLPLSAAPAALCIPDGGTGVVSISGGNTNKVINSSNPGLATALPTSGSNNFTTTISALGAGGPVGTLVTFTVSDGTNAATVSVTRKTTCP